VSKSAKVVLARRNGAAADAFGVLEDLVRRMTVQRRCAFFLEQNLLFPRRSNAPLQPLASARGRTKTVNLRTATSRQVNKDIPRVHHDALEFADGTCVLLTDLLDGQEATVLQLPAQPKTLAEEATQRRVTYVG
jgi:hypothetical protein